MIEAIMLWIIKWSLIICLICFVLICVISGIARIIEKKTGVKIIDDTPDPEDGAEAYYSADSYVGGGLQTGGLQADDGMQAEGEGDTGDVWTKDELETMAEAFVCPECGDPYDGIYCENCGHSNDEPGDEELSEGDKWLDGMMAAAMFYEDDE